MKRDCCLGIDTSCYTTSVACVANQGIVFSERTMLSVRFGERGLRQSEGLFQHTKQLAPLIEHLFDRVDRNRIAAVAVSTKPIDSEESYMPVFLAGTTVARSIAAALGVPLIETTHQTGHFRAAMVDHESLIGTSFYGFHISGGTTDLIRIDSTKNGPYRMERIGTSTDLHAGQFVDRIGVALGLPFPAGKHLEALAASATRKDVKIGSAVQGLNCSFSGAEACAMRILGSVQKEELAYGIYDCLARTFAKMLQQATLQYGSRPTLVCGGVASSSLLRSLLQSRYSGELLFGRAELSADNAVGVAYYGLDRSAAWNL
ncbi:MAG: O-sialoglycoprotein endopeptidase [Clostridia bacterium]|nr:O-sialoglycoprotein endopeptidase [Clostridia bacterium]